MFEWRNVDHETPYGIIVASDQKQEWMLPWWWKNYKQHNSFPVTFVDFGLSPSMKDWCREHGELIHLPNLEYAASKNNTDKTKVDFWETIYEGRSWWEKRVFWHQKPLAMLQTPYRYSLWLDTDCEVLAPLQELFAKLQKNEGLLIAQETRDMQEFDLAKGQLLPGEVLYNSGVIGYRKRALEILEWARFTHSEHGLHWSDQNLLSRMIFEKGWRVQELDPSYNWRALTDGISANAKIIHWVGESGKFFISLKAQNLL
jgi:hypothetical protein